MLLLNPFQGETGGPFLFAPFALGPGPWVYSHDFSEGGKGASESIKNLFGFYSPVKLNVSLIGCRSQLMWGPVHKSWGADMCTNSFCGDTGDWRQVEGRGQRRCQ